MAFAHVKRDTGRQCTHIFPCLLLLSLLRQTNCSTQMNIHRVIVARRHCPLFSIISFYRNVSVEMCVFMEFHYRLLRIGCDMMYRTVEWLRTLHFNEITSNASQHKQSPATRSKTNLSSYTFVILWLSTFCMYDSNTCNPTKTKENMWLFQIVFVDQVFNFICSLSAVLVALYAHSLRQNINSQTAQVVGRMHEWRAILFSLRGIDSLLARRFQFKYAHYCSHALNGLLAAQQTVSKAIAAHQIQFDFVSRFSSGPFCK